MNTQAMVAQGTCGRIRAGVVLLLMLTICSSALAASEGGETESPEAGSAEADAKREAAYADAREIFERAETSNAFFTNSYGYALFPTIGKAGIGIGGARGGGRVYVNGQHVGDTTMTQLTVGFQLGGQAFSQIVFFEDERAFREFSGGNFEFGAQATAVAITAGASASASTQGNTAGASGGKSNAAVAGGYNKGYAIFTVAKGGAMFEASVGGQKFSYRPVGE